MDTYKYDGERLPYANSSGSQIDSSEVVNINDNVHGIAVADIPDGETGVVAVSGVHELTRDTSDGAWSAGAELYWSGTDVTNTTGASDNIIGVAAEDAASADGTAMVLLNQGPLATG